jgi:hypothetical protein
MSKQMARESVLILQRDDRQLTQAAAKLADKAFCRFWNALPAATAPTMSKSALTTGLGVAPAFQARTLSRMERVKRTSPPDAMTGSVPDGSIPVVV